MKISNLFSWFTENILIFLIVGFFAILIMGMSFALRTDKKIHDLFPEGTEVIVKGTEIRGTVIRWGGENVGIAYVEKDGTTRTVFYNYNLLKKQ